MLMEHSAETSHGTENAKKSRSLDVQRLYKWGSGSKKGGSQSQSSGGGNSALKRKLGHGDQNGVRKKTKKEVLLSSLSSSGGKSKKSASEVYSGGFSSVSPESGKSELALDKKDNGNGGLGGISLKLNSNVNIPKRPRDLVRRKKVEVDVGSKQEVTSSSKASSGEGGQLKGHVNGNGSLSRNGTAHGKLVQNGESEGASSGSVLAKLKGKKLSDDHKENRSHGSDLLRRLRREGSHSSVHNGTPSTKKARRDNKKTKKVGTVSPGVIKETKQVLDESSRICNDSQDDEENLEANAARMLSSRFDPSCTGFSSGGKSSKLPSTNGLSALISSSRDFASAEPSSRAESDIASSDGEVRVLRPRDQQKGKGVSRKRRHFYEVMSREFDSYWVLNRRIKVFWPLDQSWYFGHVTGYDSEKKLHHIKYDDREEEWVDLQHERFKLLLLPSEVPGKKSRMHGNHTRKGNHVETADKEGNSNSTNSYMESEPIISWLAHSSRHKSPPFGRRKKQRTLNGSAKSRSSSIFERKIDPRGGLEVGSSGVDADVTVCSSVLQENSGDSKMHENPMAENIISHNNRAPIVYFRRRFHRREQPAEGICHEESCQVSREPPAGGAVPEFIDSLDIDADLFQSIDRCGHFTKRLTPDELIWNIDDSGLLKLSVSVSSLTVFRFQLSIPLPVIINKLFGEESFNFMCEHGTLISIWPMVHLEMLFIDNIVGLRFLLFEGCLKQAVYLVFLVMAVFCQSNQKVEDIEHQLPVTSVRFRLSGFKELQRPLVFTFYNFSEVANSKWSYIDRKLKKHCMLSKQLPPSECTYDNIKALCNGGKQSQLTSVSCQRSSMSLWKRSKQRKMNISSRQAACLKLSHLSCDSDEKQGKLPPFALSFAAAPTFFLSLHLRLLMERSIPSSSFGEQDPVSLLDQSPIEVGLVGVDNFLVEGSPVRSTPYVGGDLMVLPSGGSKLENCSNPGHEISSSSADFDDGKSTKPSHGSYDPQENGVEVSQLEKGKPRQNVLEHCVLSSQLLDANDQLSSVEGRVGCGPLNGMTIEIPSCDPAEKDVDCGVQESPQPVVLALDTTDGIAQSPNPSGHRSIWHQNRVGSSSSPSSANLSPGWSDGKQDYLRNSFGNGPKKPRTQVSYSLPFERHDYNTKSKFQNGKGFPQKRIRRASEKKTSEVLGTSQRNMEPLSCDANVLVTVGDRGWRHCGARIVLELVDETEWRLAVKISGDTKFSYKAHHFLQPGTTNRYTHAMMWKGGKDWILEFPDRSQWSTFKEMHEECYNRNFRAAAVKNIPIPGVRLVEENDDNVPEVPFFRASPKYYRQLETDVDIAMDPSRVLYDMDSDDERWIENYRGVNISQSGCEDISDEMFEKTMDMFEKLAFAKKCDHLSSDELEEDVSGLGPLDTIKSIYEHWREKRQRKGMPLIRHLQPPLWEKYQQQVKEWEQAMMKCNTAVANGCQEKAFTVEKPPMFAFCLKPRGLEVPNRGSKQRSQKKLPVGALGNVISADSDAFHSLVGRRLNGYTLGDERLICSAYNQGTSDSSPVLQGSMRVFSPRDAGGVGYFHLSSDASERNHYPKLYRNKSKKLSLISPPSDHHACASPSQRTMGKRTAVPGWNFSSSEWPSQMHYSPDGYQRHGFEQLDPSELDEFRLRDAASAARHAVTIAKMKRENAQRMLCRADLAMHKAVSAIMTAEAMNASYKEPPSDI